MQSSMIHFLPGMLLKPRAHSDRCLLIYTASEVKHSPAAPPFQLRYRRLINFKRSEWDVSCFALIIAMIEYDITYEDRDTDKQAYLILLDNELIWAHGENFEAVFELCSGDQ